MSKELSTVSGIIETSSQYIEKRNSKGSDKLHVTIHNPNTEEESLKLASYLFMSGNLQNALEAVDSELQSIGGIKRENPSFSKEIAKSVLA